MGWFGNRMFRGAANRSNERLAQEFGNNPMSATLALALAHACYPEATYGDNGLQDDIVTKLKTLPFRPCNAKDACDFVEKWLDRRIIPTDAVFRHVWDKAPDVLLADFFSSFTD